MRREVMTVMVLLLFVPMAVDSTIAATIVYVDADAAGAGNGTSWADAYKFLQDGLAAALSGDEIHVAQGIYKPDQGGGQTPGDRNATFQLRNGVALQGGYAGFGESNPDARNVDLYQTILSGDLSGDDAPVADPLDLLTEPTRADNSYTVVASGGAGAGTILDGFAITGGNANTAGGGGGGMVNADSNVTLKNCTFSENSASLRGGAIFGWGNTYTLDNCTFTQNSVEGQNNPHGGAILVYSGEDWRLTNCTFNGNWAGYGGGAIWISGGGEQTLTNCTFIDNSAGKFGGAIQIGGSSPTLNNCTFRGNSVINDNSYGGAIHEGSSGNPTLTGCTFEKNVAKGCGGAISNSFSSNPTLNMCTFSENSSEGGGGGMYNVESSPVLTNCTFTANSAGQGTWGGGMANVSWWGFGCSPRLMNCTFTNNSAGDGAGMANMNASSPILENCTFDGNRATSSGGGMNNRWQTSATVTNCVFRDNSAAAGGGVSNLSGPATLVNCLFIGNSAVAYGGGLTTGGGQCNIANCTFSGNSASIYGGAAMWSSDATLVNCILWGDTPDEVYSYGTTVITYTDIQGGWPGVGNIDVDPMFADADLRLRSGSFCIDAGDNAAVPADVTTDLGGNPRIQGAAVDMGAYEFQFEFLDADGDGIEDAIDTLPTAFSDAFSDAAGTSGTVTNRGGQVLTIMDEPDPEGVRIKASAGGGTTPAKVRVCGGVLLTFDAGDEVVITCGSAEVTVVHGQVEITFVAADGTAVAITLDAGNSLICEPETLTVTAPETNPDPAVVVVGGKEYTLAPGDSMMFAGIDIDPDTLNLKSAGKWITCYIELPQGYDVRSIDVGTIMFNYQVPAAAQPTSVGDHDGDGVADLMVKFNQAAVQKILTVGDSVPVTVTGKLRDGTLFGGSDTIRVIAPGGK